MAAAAAGECGDAGAGWEARWGLELGGEAIKGCDRGVIRELGE